MADSGSTTNDNKTPPQNSGGEQNPDMAKVNQTADHKSPAKLLGDILQGGKEELDNIHHPFVINGHKINNKLLKVFLLNLQVNSGLSDSEILDLFVGFDEAVEKGIITNEFMEELKTNPELMNKVLGEKEVGDG